MSNAQAPHRKETTVNLTKRQWMRRAALASLAVPAAQLAAAAPRSGLRGPGLLTVAGAIGAGNRKALDPALDQMMVKQKIAFDRAQVFDFAALAALPAVEIAPTLEYDAKPHRLRGPRLEAVLKASGANPEGGGQVLLRAVDGYTVPLNFADMRRYGFIVATHLDGAPMALGGLGPLWAVYDADRHPDMAAKPVNERFAQCPWGLYFIEVQRG